MLNDILKKFGLSADGYRPQRFGSGLINRTWKVTDPEGEDAYILQQINKNIFKSPEDITDNISKIGAYLAKHYPDYLFASALPTVNDDYAINHNDGEYYRLTPFVKNSITINTVQTRDEAFEAARQFARFTYLLADFDTADLHYTLVGFHHLTTRFSQFQQAVKTSTRQRLINAVDAIDMARRHKNIADIHEMIITENPIPLRVVHHDTKISNILYDTNHKGLCVIDLDTVMPGYFISDVGDMMRTYLSPVSEEEQDLSKIEVREDFFAAIVEGYFMEMGGILTDTEKSLFVYSGKFMIYMQAIRFLTDYLNNDIYYGASYPDHNLIRALNQFTLLTKYLQCEQTFQEIVNNCNKEMAN
jgi:hypothetical protein